MLSWWRRTRSGSSTGMVSSWRAVVSAVCRGKDTAGNAHAWRRMDDGAWGWNVNDWRAESVFLRITRSCPFPTLESDQGTIHDPRVAKWSVPQIEHPVVGVPCLPHPVTVETERSPAPACRPFGFTVNRPPSPHTPIPHQ